MYRGEATKKKPTTTLCLGVPVMSICNALYLQYMWYLHLLQYNFSDVHCLQLWCRGPVGQDLQWSFFRIKGGRVGVLSRLNCTHPPTTCNSALDLQCSWRGIRGQFDRIEPLRFTCGGLHKVPNPAVLDDVFRPHYLCKKCGVFLKEFPCEMWSDEDTNFVFCVIRHARVLS